MSLKCFLLICKTSPLETSQLKSYIIMKFELIIENTVIR